MANAIGISELGLINDMRQLEMISHNLANANTAGFKRDIAVARFADLMVEQLAANSRSTSSFEDQPFVPNVTTWVDHQAGALRHTGNALDLAIEGDGYFELADAAGVAYTRQGSFSLDASGRLVSDQGLVLNGVNGAIRLTSATPRIDQQGRVWEGEQLAGQLKVVQFPDQSKLQKIGKAMIRAQSTHAAQTMDDVSIRQGHLEASNVVVVEEMIKMMSMLRHFETTQRVIKGYDEILGTAIDTIAEF